MSLITEIRFQQESHVIAASIQSFQPDTSLFWNKLYTSTKTQQIHRIQLTSEPQRSKDFLVDLHRPVYLADEKVGRIEANGAGEQPKGQTHQ